MKSWIVFGVSFLFFSASTLAANSYRVNDGTALNILEHGRCYRVTNDSGKDLLVPTKTATEWSLFRSNRPTGVTVGDCQYTANCVGLDNDGCTKTVTCSGTSAGEEVKRIKARCNGEGNSNYSSSVYAVAWNKITTSNDGTEDNNDWCRIDSTGYPFTGGELTSTISSSALNKASFSISCRDIDHASPGECSIYVVYECAP